VEKLNQVKNIVVVRAKSGKEYSGSKGDFTAQYQTDFICDKQYLLKAIEEKSSQILDARPQARFLGEVAEPRADLRSGHMPTAKNLPFTDLIENGKMRDIKQLKAIYASLLADNENIIFSCGSGVTACVLALGATLCGYQNLTVYDGSWTEWGADIQLPVVK